MALSRRDNIRMRRLIESEWYRLRFGEAFKPLDDNWGTAKFVNDRAGFRLCTSVDGTVTGVAIKRFSSGEFAIDLTSRAELAHDERSKEDG